MKKWIALLLSLLILCSLTACGEDGGGGGGTEPPDSTPSSGNSEYDAEYEIYVNGEDEWTPFPGKSEVTFEVSEEGILSLRPTSSKVEFTGKQVGTTIITATCDESTATAFVRVVTAKSDTDSHVPARWVRYEDYWIVEYDGSRKRLSASLGSECVDCFEGDVLFICTPTWDYRFEDGEWVADENFYSPDSDELEQKEHYESLEHGRDVLLRGFDDYFYSPTFNEDTVEDFISNCYVGTETIANVECWVYECENYQQGGTYKFWVNPENGHCLKWIRDGELFYEVLDYRVPFTEWPDMSTWTFN